jgi:hypothetical protein
LANPGDNTWSNTRACGMLILGIDREKNGSRFLRLYDISTWKILFHQELYVGMKYESPVAYFHTFECDV